MVPATGIWTGSGIWGSSGLAAIQVGGELGVWTGCYTSRRKAGCLAAIQAGEESGGSSTVLVTERAVAVRC